MVDFGRAEKSVEAFRERELVMFPFLSILLQNRFTAPIVELFKLSIFDYHSTILQGLKRLKPFTHKTWLEKIMTHAPNTF